MQRRGPDAVGVMLPAGAVLLGFGLLMISADRFVAAAERIAVLRRWPPAVIGAVVVGFGTSLPELVTSAVAALGGEPDLAIGNAAGSNVANLLLILGVAVVVAPLRGAGRGPARDVAIATAAGLLLTVLAISGELGILDGVVLLAALAATVTWQIVSARPPSAVPPAKDRTWPLVAWTLAGLTGVIVGAQLLVWGATTIALAVDVPTIVIGSVLVAIGTSLPELATAVASARRGQAELLIGNLLGSNAFNALGVVGVAALLGAARGDVLAVDAAATAVVAAGGAVTLVIGLWLWRTPRMGRVVGVLLVGAYAASVPALLALS